MKKIDARVRYTQKVLKESFLKLLEEKPVNKITVKEVCELAELNRATFYAHYTDCFALLESIEDEMLEGFEESLKYIRSLDVTSLMSAIYEMIERPRLSRAGVSRRRQKNSRQNDRACKGKKHRLLARRT